MSTDSFKVLPPGQHPGGHYYWITPNPDVMVAVIRRTTKEG